MNNKQLSLISVLVLSLLSVTQAFACQWWKSCRRPNRVIPAVAHAQPAPGAQDLREPLPRLPNPAIVVLDIQPDVAPPHNSMPLPDAVAPAPAIGIQPITVPSDPAPYTPVIHPASRDEHTDFETTTISIAELGSPDKTYATATKTTIPGVGLITVNIAPEWEHVGLGNILFKEICMHAQQALGYHTVTMTIPPSLFLVNQYTRCGNELGTRITQRVRDDSNYDLTFSFFKHERKA